MEMDLLGVALAVGIAVAVPRNTFVGSAATVMQARHTYDVDRELTKTQQKQENSTGEYGSLSEGMVGSFARPPC